MYYVWAEFEGHAEPVCSNSRIGKVIERVEDMFLLGEGRDVYKAF